MKTFYRSREKGLHYILIAMIHIGFLALPCGGLRAAVLTIVVGQHQTYLPGSRVQSNPTDTDTPMIGSYLSVYQEADWFNWPIYASDGTPLATFQLVYDGRGNDIAFDTPELGTWSMTILGALLIAGKLTRRRLQAAKAALA